MSDNDQDYIVIEGDNETILVENDIAIIEVAERGPPGAVGTTNPKEFVVAFNATNTVVNWENGDIAILTLTGNTTVSMIGTRKKCLLVVVQDAVGSRIITWDSASIGFGIDIPSIPLSSLPNKTDYLGFAYNEATGKQNLVGFSRGY